MAISSFFQGEIDEVDNTKTLVFNSGEPGYAEFEWSYNGLQIYGGTDLACEYGAAALLEAMGFRYYSPNEAWGYIRPASIPTNLSAVKQEYWITNISEFLTYGHSWAGSNVASRTLLNDRYDKFRTLLGCRTAVYPAGHRWNNVITSNQAFFDSNPQLLLTSDRFDLSVTGQDYDDLTEMCAAHMLNSGLNEWDRTNFDPTDGDTQPSDDVYPFTLDVATKMRNGAGPIGTISAQTGVAGAQIGIYAYAGHRLPPTNSYTPGVYTQVALAFNDTELTYLELVEQHGTKADLIALREYWDTHTWSNGKPIVNARSDNQYFSDDYTGASYASAGFYPYDDYVDAGVVALNSEYSANWFVNLVQHRWAMNKCKNGTGTYADALDDVMADVFDDDQAVRDLYELWSDGDSVYNKASLLASFDLVDDMQTSTYKTYFQYLCVIWYEQLYLPPQLATNDPDHNTPSDPFPAAFAEYMAHVTAIRDLDIAHCYAWLRREANGAVSSTYPDLWMYADPEPDWFANPYLPTESDFTSYHAALAADVAATVPSDMNVISTWKGAVEPAAEAASGDEIQLWKGAVEPANIVVAGGSAAGATSARRNKARDASIWFERMRLKQEDDEAVDMIRTYLQ